MTRFCYCSSFSRIEAPSIAEYTSSVTTKNYEFSFLEKKSPRIGRSMHLTLGGACFGFKSSHPNYYVDCPSPPSKFSCLGFSASQKLTSASGVLTADSKAMSRFVAKPQPIQVSEDPTAN